MTSEAANPDADLMSVPITDGEGILRLENREISIVVARENLMITRARYAAGEPVAGPHVHHAHTDAFYVLEGELTFQIGAEAETITVSAGGFLAAPPGVAHSLRNASGRPARWLTIHVPDGGFAAFMRGLRDGVKVTWDISAVPSGGRPAGKPTFAASTGPKTNAVHTEVAANAGIERLRRVLHRRATLVRPVRDRRQLRSSYSTPAQASAPR